MKQTANYQLSQWEPSDRILREDFNADNAKVDAVLAKTAAAADRVDAAIAAAAPIVKLLDVTTTSTVQQIDLDLSGIRLADYQKVVFFLDVGVNASVRLNGCDGREDYGCIIANSNATRNIFADLMGEGLNRIELFSNSASFILGTHFALRSHIAVVSECYQFTGSDDLLGVAPKALRANQLATMNIFSSEPIPAGAHFMARGVRK